MKAIYLAATAFLLSLTPASSARAADSKAQTQGPDLIAHASSVQGIRERGSKPFFLHMTIHAENIVTKPVDGVYQEVWMAPEKWRREIAFPGFQQLEIGDFDSKWVTRNLEFRPRAAYLTAIAIDSFVHPTLTEGEKFRDTRQRKKDGRELQCSELVFGSGRISRELCFDDSGTLASEEHQDKRFEYGDYTSFGEKVFPRSIRVFEGGRKVLEISADPISAPPGIEPSLFQHGTEARQMASCEKWLVQPTTKVPPRYPPDARASHQQGTVRLYVLLSPDGDVKQMNVVHSAGASLDGSTIEAVRQWKYSSAGCGSAPLEMEIEVSVNYELR